MAASAAAGAASGLPGPVAQGLKEALVDTLTGILSPVQEVRAAAEEQIKVLEVTEVWRKHCHLRRAPSGIQTHSWARGGH